jgi:hypothetical protein
VYSRKASGIIVKAKGYEIAARGPGIVANLTVWRIGNFNYLSIRHRHHIELSILVAECDALTVRRPFRLITHGATAACDLLRGFQTVLRHYV